MKASLDGAAGGKAAVKRTLGDLACFGGTSLFETVRPIGQLARPDREKFFRYARVMYDGRCCTNNGPLVRELERRLAELHGVEHCVAYASASLALVAAMHILAPESGEVIMPAFTYSGLPHLAQWAGHLPRFCDIDPERHVLDPASVEAVLNGRTALVLAVHQVNSPCDVDALQEICDAHGLPLLFDSVHGLGGTYKGLPIGLFGRAEIFSLHATKMINGFEGGYVTTNDAALAAGLRMGRNFGFTGRDRVDALGLNAKLNEMHAALALTTMDDLPRLIERNRQRYEAYLKAMAGLGGVSLVPYPEGESYNYEFSILDLDGSWAVDRDQVVRLLRAENALARAYYSPPVHLSDHCPPNLVPPSLPVTEALARRMIQMPVGEMVNEADIARLGEFIAFIRANQEEIAGRFREEGRS